MRVVYRRRELEAIARIGDDVLGVAAVEVIAGEACEVAQILFAAQTEFALSARVTEPRHAEPRAERHADTVALRDDFADDFVSWHERRSEKRQVAVHDVQVCATHAACMYAQEQLSGLWDRQRPQLRDELRAGPDASACIWIAGEPILQITPTGTAMFETLSVEVDGAVGRLHAESAR